MTFTLITGASSGIGRKLAVIMATQGHNLILTGRDAGRLQDTARLAASAAPVIIHTIRCDLTGCTGADELFREISERGWTIDILINNAGLGQFGPFAGSAWEQAHAMLHVNIESLTRLTHLFLPGMLQQRQGRIMNVASTAAFQPGPLMAVYYASKAFVLSFSEALASETAGSGVTVTAFCPGPTDTGFQHAAGLENSKLFSRLSVAAADSVARYGYRAMMRGRTIAIYGLGNKIMIFGERLAPRRLTTRMVRIIQSQRKQHA